MIKKEQKGSSGVKKLRPGRKIASGESAGSRVWGSKKWSFDLVAHAFNFNLYDPETETGGTL